MRGWWGGPCDIHRCVELGLRKPEFRQDEDFTAVLWRKEVSQDEAKVVSSNDPVSDPVNDPVSDFASNGSEGLFNN